MLTAPVKEPTFTHAREQTLTHDNIQFVLAHFLDPLLVCLLCPFNHGLCGDRLDELEELCDWKRLKELPTPL